jgi:PKD repeat protein
MKNFRILFASILLIGITTASCHKAADAGFTYTQNGAGGVNFVNTSSNASSYNWNFGDGSTSTATSPSHTYTPAGSYTISLTADGSAGNSTNTQTILVQ